MQHSGRRCSEQVSRKSRLLRNGIILVVRPAGENCHFSDVYCHCVYAFTVKSAPNVKITGEMTFRTQMLFGWVADGQSIHEITDKGGYF